MNSKDIKIGLKLELELINSIGEKIGQTYVSQMIDAIDDHHILIAAPIHESRFMLITTGTKIRLVFMHNTQGLLAFQGVIIGKEQKGNILIFKIEIQTEFEKIQRRKYFRLDSVLNARYRVIKEKDETAEIVEEEPLQKCFTRNLSGSGAGIAINDELKKNTPVYLEIELDQNTIKVESKVIRCIELPVQRGKKYEAGLYFSKISQKDQDILVKFIFDQQRKLLKNTQIDRD